MKVPFVVVTAATLLRAAPASSANMERNSGGYLASDLPNVAAAGVPVEATNIRILRRRKLKSQLPINTKGITFSQKNITNIFQGQKQHIILHQGINIDVSNILDRIELFIEQLHKKIHGIALDEKHTYNHFRKLQDDPKDRVSSIINNLAKIFPRAQARYRRSSTYEEEYISKSNSQNSTTGNLHQDDIRHLLHWYNLGYNVAERFRNFVYSLGDTILSEYIGVINAYLRTFKEHDQSTDHQNKTLSIQTSEADIRKPLKRKKRFIDDSSSEYSQYKYHSVGDRNENNQRLKEILSEMRSIVTTDDNSFDAYDRHDNYNGQHGSAYGGSSYHQDYKKINPYVLLASLSACVFFGLIAISLYCKMSDSPCCPNALAGDNNIVLNGPSLPTIH